MEEELGNTRAWIKGSIFIMDPFILLNFKLYEFISCSQNKQFGSFVKIGSLYDTAIPLLGNYPREIIKTHIHTQTCIQIYSDLAG